MTRKTVGKVSTRYGVVVLMVAAVVGWAIMGFLTTGTAAANLVPTRCALDEDFSGSWMPGGWSQEESGEWTQEISPASGMTPPEAVLVYFNIAGTRSYLDTKPVDTSAASSLTLEFTCFIVDSQGGYNCTVYTRANAADFWTHSTPWTNPVSGNVGPSGYSMDISSDIGSATQARFEFEGPAYNLTYWYLDDVKICGDLPAPPPGPVGGEAYPVKTMTVLAPWSCLAGLLAGGMVLFTWRRRRAHS